MDIREALNDVEIAFLQLEFSIRLLSYCELGKVDAKDFDTDHLVQLPEGNLHFKSGHFGDPDNILRAANVSVLLAFSGTAILLDKAFELAGLKPNPKSEDDASKLRALVFMVRCAHAHGLADPRWEVRGDFRRPIALELEGRKILLDLTKLHGQTLHIEQLGGYTNWYAIRRAARNLLQPEE